MSDNKPIDKTKAEEIVKYLNKGSLTAEEIKKVENLGRELEEEIIFSIKENHPTAAYLFYNPKGYAAITQGKYAENYFYVYDSKNRIIGKLWLDENSIPFVAPIMENNYLQKN